MTREMSLAVLLLATVGLLYLPSLSGRFLTTYDDDLTVVAGVELHDLTERPIEKVSRILDVGGDRRLAGLSAEYLPARDLSFAVDRYFFSAVSASGEIELNPVGYRIGNLLLYMLAGLTFFSVLRRAGLETATAWLAATLWLIHPMHVENVAWVSSRKDVLSAAFFTMAILLHLVAGSRRGGARIGLEALAVGLGVAAMFSKGTAVVLLPTLVLIDAARRLAPGERRWDRARVAGLTTHLVALLVVLSIHLGVLSGGLGATPFVRPDPPPLVERIQIMAPVAVDYLRLSIAPIGLATERAPPTAPALLCWGAALLILGLAAAALLSWRRAPAASAGTLFFLGALAPVANLVVVMPHWRADRYVFIPGLGLAVVASTALMWLCARRPRLGRVLVASVLVFFAVATLAEQRHWRSDLALWQRTIEVEPEAPHAHVRLAHAWRDHAARQQAAGDTRGMKRAMEESQIELVRALEIFDQEEDRGGRRAIIARANLGAILVGRALDERRLALAEEALAVLAPALLPAGSSRDELASSLVDLPGYDRVRALLDALHESWAPLRPALEQLVSREESNQIAAWRAITAPGEAAWHACLAVMERELEIAAERGGTPVDAEALALISPGWLRVRRAVAFMTLGDPSRVAELVLATALEGTELPDSIDKAISSARALVDVDSVQAEIQLMRCWAAAPQHPQPYRAIEQLREAMGDREGAARFGRAARALEVVER